jgi:hypothetical protein
MRKKFAALLIVFSAVAGVAALLAPTPAHALTCPKGSHVFVCPYGSFCCPNNAFCACLIIPPPQ